MSGDARARRGRVERLEQRVVEVGDREHARDVPERARELVLRDEHAGDEVQRQDDRLDDRLR